MAKKKNGRAHMRDGAKCTFTNEELQNMEFRLTLNVPKSDFDNLLKAMMDIAEKPIHHIKDTNSE